MPKTEEFVDIEVDEDEMDFDDGDFGFIISSDGELKHMMIPENYMDDPPVQVKKLLKIFGIKDLHTLSDRTLH